MVYPKPTLPSLPSTTQLLPRLKLKQARHHSHTANCSPTARPRPSTIAFFIQATQQLLGINMVSTYANKILADSFNPAPGLSHLIAACGGAERALFASVHSSNRGPRTKTCVHVDRIRHGYLLCHHCRSVVKRRSYPAARRRRVSLPLQYLPRSCMGWRSIPLFSRNHATEVQSPSERHRQCRQLDLLRRGHDHPARDGEPWLENVHVSAKQTANARLSKKKKS